MRNLTSIVLLGSSLLLGACMNKGDGDIDSASDAVDSSDSTQAEGNVMMAAVDGSSTQGLAAVTDVQVAAAISANVGTRMLPAGCAVPTVNGAKIAIQYNDCTGPRGLVHVTGELDLTISIDGAGAIDVAASASGLEVNGATLDIDATAVYAVTGSDDTLTVQTMGTGTGPRGTAIDHDGNYTIGWDATNQCASIAGTWSTELGAADRSNTVNLSECGGSCPTGTLSHKYLAGITLNVAFDGTAVATWSLSTGGSGTVALSCTPAS
jgi:hypothetical protein